jgi:hypothetical protein
VQGKLDPRPLEKQKMADSNQITLNPVVQTADPQRVLTEGTSEIAGANVLAEPCVDPVSLP